MSATNVNVTPKRLAPLGGAGHDGTRLVSTTASKAAQSDTVTFKNVKKILWASATTSDGTNTQEDVVEVTDATNVIELSSTTTGTANIIAIVR